MAMTDRDVLKRCGEMKRLRADLAANGPIHRWFVQQVRRIGVVRAAGLLGVTRQAVYWMLDGTSRLSVERVERLAESLLAEDEIKKGGE